ncbi:MAG: ABC transporter permease [Acidobacteriota bacterium]
MMGRVLGSVRSLFSRRKMESDLDEELRFHVEAETERNLRRGMTPEEARTEALRRFGGVEKVKDEVREADRAVLLETILQDVRYGVRSLRKNPGYAIAAILTLALGIGANTAIFSVVHGVLLHSLPYGGGDRLVRVRADAPGAGIADGAFSPLDVADLNAQARSLSGVAEYHSMWFVLLGRKEPERVQTGVVSDRFFDLLGVRPLLGRTFLPGEDKKGAEAVLVLSYAYWMRSFGGDPGVVGRVFQMNDRAHTVVGVLPPIPGYPDDNDVYMPIHACPFRSAEHMENDRSMGMLAVFGRLKPGATLAGAKKDLDAVAAHWMHDYPKDYPATIGLKLDPLPLTEELTRSARPTFLVLLATVGLVLLLACANVANLTLARLIRRERELALRAALGAGRARLIRQLLTESVLLALVGGALGLIFAFGVRGLLVHFAARFTPRAAEITIDGPVLVFTLGVSLLTGIVFGLLPSFTPRRTLTIALQQGSDRNSGTAGRLRLRNLLIVGQVAISFVLLIGAGLMLRTLWKLKQIDPGFRADRVLTSRLDLNFSKYTSSDERRAFQDRLLERLATEPGVLTVALAGNFPLNDRGGPNSGRFRLEGRPPVSDLAMPRADFQRVSPEYFKTIGVPLMRGRALERTDRPETPRVALVNQSFARRYYPGEDPIGRRLQIPNSAPGAQGEVPWITIVGVVGDVRQYSLSSPPAEQIYLAMAQYPGLSMNCLIRTAADPMQMAAQVRNAVHAIGSEQPVDHFRTLEQVREGTLDSPRLTALLLVLFAALAVAITATGIAGVISFSVGQRIQEFGIRMALGAAPRAVLGMVLRQALALVLAGLGLGLAAALLLTRLISGLLYEIAPTDPATYLAVALLLFSAALVAAFVPARRATAVDPMVALRSA